MPAPNLGLEKATTLHEATKHLQFSDIAPIDLKDRLALATVAAGLRLVGVLEADGLKLEPIREMVINYGLHTLISPRVSSRMAPPPRDARNGTRGASASIKYPFRVSLGST